MGTSQIPQDGPHDFHFKDGALVGGLGSDSPSLKQREELAAKMEAEHQAEEAIKNANQANVDEANRLAGMEASLDAREAQLAADLAELEELRAARTRTDNA